MSDEDKLDQAVQNNAHWYEALCRIHGVSGERHAGYWISRGTVPPYMSNLITLTGAAQVEAQVAAIGKRGGVSLATAALNRSGEVVGLSNVFGGAESVGPLFPGAVRLAAQLYPSLPIVGYERGASLIDAQRAGFEPLSSLTVWNRS